MECITSSHSNMRYWPITTHILSQTVQRTCSSNVGPQISSNAIIFSHSNAKIFDQSWRIYTLSENPQKTFIWSDLLQKMDLLQRHKSPYLIITSCELPSILTPSIKVVIDKW